MRPIEFQIAGMQPLVMWTPEVGFEIDYRGIFIVRTNVVGRNAEGIPMTWTAENDAAVQEILKPKST